MIKEHENAGGIAYQVYGRQRVDGRSVKVYVGTFATRREAERADEDHRARQRQIKSGELPAASDPRRTLGAALDAWLKSIEKQRSHYEYTVRLERYVRPTLSAKPLVSVTEDVLRKLRGELETRIAPGTINTLFGTLSAFFTWARGKKWISVSPTEGIKSLKVPKRKYAWLTSPAEIEKLLAACNATIKPIVAILVGTGMRLDEALHLQWSDVDLELRHIEVHRGRRGGPKTGDRHVPIFDSVLTVLRELKIAAGKNTLLFPGRKRVGGHQRPLDKSSVFRAFKRAVAKAGLSKELRQHDLRHSFASIYLRGGGDMFRLSRILGHADIKITISTYAHLAPDAYHQDYGRVAFSMPSEDEVAKVLEFPGASGQTG